MFLVKKTLMRNLALQFQTFGIEIQNVFINFRHQNNLSIFEGFLTLMSIDL